MKPEFGTQMFARLRMNKNKLSLIGLVSLFLTASFLVHIQPFYMNKRKWREFMHYFGLVVSYANQ